MTVQNSVRYIVSWKNPDGTIVRTGYASEWLAERAANRAKGNGGRDVTVTPEWAHETVSTSYRRPGGLREQGVRL